MRRLEVTPGSPAAEQAAQVGTGKTPTSDAKSSPPTRAREGHPRVAWIGGLLIVLMLLVGAGWELWRWLLLVVSLD